MPPAPRTPKPDLPWVEVDDPAAWERWLDEHHETSDGVWLILAKKDAPNRMPRRAEALDIALRFGWIDGQVMGIDEHSWRQRFTPRRAKSKWSLINRERTLELIEMGVMRPAGLAEVARAQADGRWDAAYAPPSRATVPQDFAAALAAQPVAEAFFATLSNPNRYAFIYRIEDAKRPETRVKRIDQYVAMLLRGETFH